MNVSALKKSNFLKKEDCGPSGILVTIQKVIEENIAKSGDPEDFKWCMYFTEHEKPLVLNPTNGQLLAAIFGTTGHTGDDESDAWLGKKIVLYNEPSVSYGGKVTGGIRVRAPRGQAAKAVSSPAAKPAPEKSAPAYDYDAPPEALPDDDDKVPF